jgi:hypothetical protein
LEKQSSSAGPRPSGDAEPEAVAGADIEEVPF